MDGYQGFCMYTSELVAAYIRNICLIFTKDQQEVGGGREKKAYDALKDKLIKELLLLSGINHFYINKIELCSSIFKPVTSILSIPIRHQTLKLFNLHNETLS